jgi:hypothetical protein
MGLMYEDATIEGFSRAQTTGHHFCISSLRVVGFFAMLLLILPAVQVHYVLWRVLWRLLGHEGGPSLSVAMALGWASAVMFFFLWQDRVGVLGNARLREKLLAKSQAVLPSGANVPHYFVEMRLNKKSDLGILYLYPDRIVFVGDVWQVTLPKGLLPNTPPRWEPVLPGITAAWLKLRLANNTGTLRLLARDNITALSQTYEHGAALRESLANWQK